MSRQQLGIVFSYNEGWVAGSYYLINLIFGLKTLADEDQPEISIISSKKSDFIMVKEQTAYPHLNYFEVSPLYPSLPVKIVNILSRFFSGKNAIDWTKYKHDFDMIYPSVPRAFMNHKLPKIGWVPDLQEEYYPEFFSVKELELRRSNLTSLSQINDAIVFSSEAAKKDFQKFYPDYKCDLEVLPFAVTHPEYTDLNLSELKEQYALPELYFFAPNQFWKHKNHMMVLEAIKQAKNTNQDVHVAFSGKEEDYRNPDYFGQLKSFVSANDLQKNVSFLGFIDRTHQLKLMSGAVAVIQASLFEGWSTVVEDAKAMNQFVFASDLAVHKEQLSENCIFFNPNNPEALSQLMNEKVKKTSGNTINYKENITVFGRIFSALIKKYSQQ